jgi:uncharacterized YccA/Bax inhibitor family protein
MATAVKSAFDRINKEYGPGISSPGSVARSGAPTTAPPVRPTGPAPEDPAPFGEPGSQAWAAPGSYSSPSAWPANAAPPADPARGHPAPAGYRGGGGWGGYGGRGGWGGGGWGGGGWGYGPSAAATGTQAFSAARAYDKLIALCIMALVAGIFGYVAVPIGLALGCMLVAFGLAMVSWFRMGWSRVLAPAYSVLEGVALGAVSAEYATLGHGIVPTAIVFTAGVFLGALVLYRTGLVRVTSRMVSLAFMGCLGLVAVSVLSLIGLSLPGVNSFGTAGLLFGIFALGVAVLNLFTDFEYVRQSERLGVSSEAEWPAAFAMMTALVLVYISILRILGALYGGGRRQ